VLFALNREEVDENDLAELTLDESVDLSGIYPLNRSGSLDCVSL
jgi:hypothetical protein